MIYRVFIIFAFSLTAQWAYATVALECILEGHPIELDITGGQIDGNIFKADLLLSVVGKNVFGIPKFTIPDLFEVAATTKNKVKSKWSLLIDSTYQVELVKSAKTWRVRLLHIAGKAKLTQPIAFNCTNSSY